MDAVVKSPLGRILIWSRERASCARCPVSLGCDRPAEAGEFARGGDGGDRAALARCSIPCQRYAGADPHIITGLPPDRPYGLEVGCARPCRSATPTWIFWRIFGALRARLWLARAKVVSKAAY